MMTLHPSVINSDSRNQDKPECCIAVAKGHCPLHCPRIEDVLYSQRKGKTNKGAQRWRCKICGTKWTSKQTPIPPVVPDTIANSIQFGNGPEEISMDMRAVTRPFKKSRIGEPLITSPFPSTLYSGNTSPSQSPIPSPPSPISSILSSTVPNSRTINTSQPTGLQINNANNNFVPILPTLPRATTTTTTTSLAGPLQSNKIQITTKPVVVMSPSQSSNISSPTPQNPISSGSTSKSLLPIPNPNINNSHSNNISNGNSNIINNINNSINNSINNINNPNNLNNSNGAITNANRVVPLGRPSKSTGSVPILPTTVTAPSGNTYTHPPLSPKSQKLANLFNNYMATHPGAGLNTPKHGNFKGGKSSMITSPQQAKVPTGSSILNNNSSNSNGRVPDYHSPPTPQHQKSSSSQQTTPQNEYEYVYLQPPTQQGHNNDAYMHQSFLHPQQQQSQQAQQQPIPMNLFNHHLTSIHFANPSLTTYSPSQNLVECLKKVLVSVSYFLPEFGVENRVKLSSYLNFINLPSTDNLFSNSLCKALLTYIDQNCFKVSKHYQSLYQVISKHLAMMDDPLQPLSRVYFDEQEINRFLVFIDHAKSIDDVFELILSEIQSMRDQIVQKKESIENSMLDPINNLTQSTNSQLNTSGSQPNNSNNSTPNNSVIAINLEQTKQDSSRVLESLGPLESTLSTIETKLRATQKDINILSKVFSIIETLYASHFQHHQSIIDKHSKIMQNYIVDVIQQTLYNADVLSASYNKMKISLAHNSLALGKRLREDNDELALIDTNSPFVNTLNDVLSKFDRTINLLPQQNIPQQPQERRVVGIYHTLCLDHNVPEEHPESPKRLSSVIAAITDLSKSFPGKVMIKSDPNEVEDKWILTVHSPEYLRQLEQITEKLDANEIRALNAPDGANNQNITISHQNTNSNNSNDDDENNSDGVAMDTSTNNNSNSSSGECEDGDTFISKLSLKAAKRSAGATIQAIDLVVSGKVSSAFVACRPPGHHAGRDGLTSGTSSQGFCLLNNVCIGAKYAQLKYDLKRIAIVDIDVHHGNGTEEIVANDSGFLFCSIHMFEEGFYPGSGAASQSVNVSDYSDQGNNEEPKLNTNISSNDNIVNIPLDPKSSATSFLKAFSIIIDKLHEYKPELLMISCGFDAHIDDHLASLCLSEDNYIEITKQLRIVADKWCKGRIISVLEGGYNINALKQCTIAHLMSLVED